MCFNRPAVFETHNVWYRCDENTDAMKIMQNRTQENTTPLVDSGAEQGLEHLPQGWRRKMHKIVRKYGKDSSVRRSIIIASGGTGGHIFPAQALAEILTNRYNMIWVTDKRGSHFLLMDPEHMCYVSEYHTLLSGPMQGGVKGRLYSLFKITCGTLQAMYHILRCKPIAVIGFGGYATVPVICAAIFCRTTIILHEQNAILGLVNRVFARFAALIMLGFPNTQKLDKKYAKNAIVLGNPIRRKVWEYGQYASSNRRVASQLKLLILGGSQGARILCDKVPEAIALLPDSLRKRLIIKQQALAHNVHEMQLRYKTMDVQDVQVVPFFNNIGEVMRDCDAVIGRAGASTIAELEYFGIPSLLVPLALAKDNHQYFNARYLVDKGVATMLEEHQMNDIGTLTSAIADLLDEKKLKDMRERSQLALRHNTAGKIAVKINQLFM